jgi:chemotaxis protein methyltransferase CheR
MAAKPQRANARESVVGEIRIRPDEYEEMLRLIKDVTGIHLAAGKQSMIQRRLNHRLKALGLSSFTEYCKIIRSGDSVEIEQLSNAVTTNLTAFFREAHHFDMLADDVFPKLISAARERGESVRIWCAGCSTGEEPYSVAMVLGEMESATAGVDIKILATDLDSDALSHGEAGIYTTDRVKHLAEERLQQWFVRGTGANSGLVRIKPQLKEMISFKPLNLMYTWPMSGSFDIVFCRNVIIYFDKDTQTKLLERFSRIMRTESFLFLGHSESLMNITDRFTLLGRSVYTLAAA